jgi:hypothetical protein
MWYFRIHFFSFPPAAAGDSHSPNQIVAVGRRLRTPPPPPSMVPPNFNCGGDINRGGSSLARQALQTEAKRTACISEQAWRSLLMQHVLPRVVRPPPAATRIRPRRAWQRGKFVLGGDAGASSTPADQRRLGLANVVFLGTFSSSFAKSCKNSDEVLRKFGAKINEIVFAVFEWDICWVAHVVRAK